MLNQNGEDTGLLIFDPKKVIADFKKDALELEREGREKHGDCPVVLVSLYHFVKEQPETWIVPLEDEEQKRMWKEVRQHFKSGYAPFAVIAMRPVNAPEIPMVWERWARVFPVWEKSLADDELHSILESAIQRADPSMKPMVFNNVPTLVV